MSSRFEGTVYRLLEDGSIQTFATDLGVACGLAFASDGTLFVGDRSGTIFRVDRRRPDDDVRDAAGERRGVSSGVRPDDVALRDGADAVALRRGLPDRSRRRASTRCRTRSAGRRGSRSTPRARCSSSRRWPARAACIVCPSGRARARRSPVPIWSASRSIGRARWSSARTTPPTGCRCRRRGAARHALDRAARYLRRSAHFAGASRTASQCRVQSAAAESVHEVDHQADREPQAEADPRDPRQAEHQVAAGDDAERPARAGTNGVLNAR